jgi:hypothetical protein
MRVFVPIETEEDLLLALAAGLPLVPWRPGRTPVAEQRDQAIAALDQPPSPPATSVPKAA